jgi:YfiH family protein
MPTPLEAPPVQNLLSNDPHPFGNFPNILFYCSVGEACPRLDSNPGDRANLLSLTLQLPTPRPLILPKQQHTDRVFILKNGEQLPTEPQIADALLTNRNDVLIGVRTADCVPILVAGESPTGTWVGAIHSGWRGTRQRILQRTLEAMEHLGVVKTTLAVWIGPHISMAKYEVSAELAEEFCREFFGYERIVEGRQLNLGEVNRQMALQFGLASKQIVVSDCCTNTESERFPSYRRDGRCISHIYSVMGIR